MRYNATTILFQSSLQNNTDIGQCTNQRISKTMISLLQIETLWNSNLKDQCIPIDCELTTDSYGFIEPKKPSKSMTSKAFIFPVVPAEQMSNFFLEDLVRLAKLAA